ncbi:MAG: 50S ribosome-binding GTPase [Candidatus Aenigmarchaeota archaeon]|nr:50S ribosome-binding GTPase [Candidatus Aenigmarchaeota archaeon]
MGKNKFLAKSSGFRYRIRRIIESADLVIEVLDARDPFGTKNTEVEKLVKMSRKRLLTVVNKVDLVKSVDYPESSKTCIISSKNRRSAAILKDFIKANLPKTPARVAIVGYPNVGKSTIINLLKGRKSASVAPIPGHTKGVQWVRVDEDILLLDSPGIVPSYEKDVISIAIKGAIEADQIKNPERVAHSILEKILSENPGALEKFYDIKLASEDPQEILVTIAVRRGRLLKRSEPDTLSAAKTVIRDRYKGKI